MNTLHNQSTHEHTKQTHYQPTHEHTKQQINQLTTLNKYTTNQPTHEHTTQLTNRATNTKHKHTLGQINTLRATNLQIQSHRAKDVHCALQRAQRNKTGFFSTNPVAPENRAYTGICFISLGKMSFLILQRNKKFLKQLNGFKLKTLHDHIVIFFYFHAIPK